MNKESQCLECGHERSKHKISQSFSVILWHECLIYNLDTKTNCPCESFCPGAPKEPTGMKCPIPHCGRTDPLPHRHDFIDDARKANHKFCDNCGYYYIEPVGKHICPKSVPKECGVLIHANYMRCANPIPCFLHDPEENKKWREKMEAKQNATIPSTINDIVRKEIEYIMLGGLKDKASPPAQRALQRVLTILELIEKEAYERGCEDEAERQGFQVVEREKIALAQGRAEMQAICIAAVKKLKTAQLQPQPLGPDQIMRDALVNQVVYRLQSLQ